MLLITCLVCAWAFISYLYATGFFRKVNKFVRYLKLMNRLPGPQRHAVFGNISQLWCRSGKHLYVFFFVLKYSYILTSNKASILYMQYDANKWNKFIISRIGNCRETFWNRSIFRFKNALFLSFKTWRYLCEHDNVNYDFFNI